MRLEAARRHAPDPVLGAYRLHESLRADVFLRGEPGRIERKLSFPSSSRQHRIAELLVRKVLAADVFRRADVLDLILDDLVLELLFWDARNFGVQLEVRPAEVEEAADDVRSKHRLRDQRAELPAVPTDVAGAFELRLLQTEVVERAPHHRTEVLECVVQGREAVGVDEEAEECARVRVVERGAAAPHRTTENFDVLGARGVQVHHRVDIFEPTDLEVPAAEHPGHHDLRAAGRDRGRKDGHAPEELGRFARARIDETPPLQMCSVPAAGEPQITMSRGGARPDDVRVPDPLA